MKWKATPAFYADHDRLSDSEKKLFSGALKTFIKAAEAVAAEPGNAKWPKRLRAKDVQGAPGIWELTWSFSGPDGRATFEWITVDGEPGVFWRRVGGHEIFKEPTGLKKQR